jgi:hypothetical protein
LVVLEVRGSGGLSAADTLPPNLRTLKLHFGYQSIGLKPRTDSDVSLRPLLTLSKLEQLHLNLSEVACTTAAAHQLAQLSTLHSLQELHIL